MSRKLIFLISLCCVLGSDTRHFLVTEGWLDFTKLEQLPAPGSSMVIFGLNVSGKKRATLKLGQGELMKESTVTGDTPYIQIHFGVDVDEMEVDLSGIGVNRSLVSLYKVSLSASSFAQFVFYKKNNCFALYAEGHPLPAIVHCASSNTINFSKFTRYAVKSINSEARWDMTGSKKVLKVPHKPTDLGLRQELDVLRRGYHSYREMELLSGRIKSTGALNKCYRVEESRLADLKDACITIANTIRFFGYTVSEPKSSLINHLVGKLDRC